VAPSYHRLSATAGPVTVRTARARIGLRLPNLRVRCASHRLARADASQPVGTDRRTPGRGCDLIGANCIASTELSRRSVPSGPDGRARMSLGIRLLTFRHAFRLAGHSVEYRGPCNVTSTPASILTTTVGQDESAIFGKYTCRAVRCSQHAVQPRARGRFRSRRLSCQRCRESIQNSEPFLGTTQWSRLSGCHSPFPAATRLPSPVAAPRRCLPDPLNIPPPLPPPFDAGLACPMQPAMAPADATRPQVADLNPPGC
jgi:hypothetical protein